MADNRSEQQERISAGMKRHWAQLRSNKAGASMRRIMAAEVDELIANVDDVTIEYHVIVPRASWDEIVRLLKAGLRAPNPDGNTITGAYWGAV